MFHIDFPRAITANHFHTVREMQLNVSRGNIRRYNPTGDNIPGGKHFVPWLLILWHFASPNHHQPCYQFIEYDVFLSLTGHCFPRGRISTTYATTLSRNKGKCKYKSCILKQFSTPRELTWKTARQKYYCPACTLRNKDVVITSKRRHFDVIMSKWRRFDVITTSLLRHVFSGWFR